MLRIKFDVLEDIVSHDQIEAEDTQRAYAPDALVGWWRTALDRLQMHPLFAQPNRNPDMIKRGMGRKNATIHVMLCSRSSATALFEHDTALGIHAITAPDTDPFNEDAPYAREYRVLMISDKEEFLKAIATEAELDLYQGRHLPEYISSYANTVFHEICHALLFAENANLLPPNDISNLSDCGDIDNDLFDHSTGYGMRPLRIDGEDIWADDIDEATDLMEQYVEALGRELMLWTFNNELHPLTLLTAMGLEAEVEEIYASDSSQVKII